MTAPIRSTLLVGKVCHSRGRPRRYALEHDVWYFGLDLNELDQVFRLTRLLRRNRRAVLELRDADHLPAPARDLPREIRGHLRAEGLDDSGWHIELVTNLRIAGYVFNPASFFLCRDVAGAIRAIVLEVHNTYGERHLYTLQPTVAATTPPVATRTFAATMGKHFWVSPFIGLDGRYSVTVRDQGRSLHIAINLRDRDGPLLATSLVLERRPLTRTNVIRLLLRYPFMTQRTIGLIHWHALRLWLRGVPFRAHIPKQAIPERVS